MTPRRILWVFLALYAAAVVVVVSWPVPVDGGAVHSTLALLIHRLNLAGLTFITYPGVEFAANIVMFVPLGLLLAALTGPGRRLLVLAFLVAGALAIEFGQWVFLPHRFASAGDVLANSLGALIGVVIAATALPARRGPSRPD